MLDFAAMDVINNAALPVLIANLLTVMFAAGVIALWRDERRDTLDPSDKILARFAVYFPLVIAALGVGRKIL